MIVPTSFKKRHVIAVAFLGIALILYLQPSEQRSSGSSNDSHIDHEPPAINESSDISPRSNPPLRTKTNLRPIISRSTIEETNRMLRKTILTRLKTDSDITVFEFVAAINEAIQAVGVAPHELRICVNRGDEVATLRLRDSLQLGDVTVHNALNAHFGRTKITYKPREGGRVDLVDMTQEPPDLPDPLQKPLRPSSGETDIFGNDPNASEEIDPFTDPPAR